MYKGLQPNPHRELNCSVLCECGISYISGYLNCPKCGRRNPLDIELEKQIKEEKLKPHHFETSDD